MKLYKTITFTTLLLFTAATLPAFANIESTAEAVQQANSGTDENSNAPDEKSETSKERPVKQYHHNDDHSFSQLMLDIFFGIWIYDNGAVSFEPYPYAVDGKYLHFNLTASPDPLFAQDRPFRYAVATSTVYASGIGFGNESCFEGFLFKFIGPLFENTVYTGLHNITGNVKLGGQMALLQTNPISILFYCQWVHWYGTIGDYLPFSGFSGGIIMKSYPVKPLVFEWKFGGQNFGSDYASFLESDLRAGVLFNRSEAFVSWKYQHISNDTTQKIYSRSNGVTIGTRLYF